LDIAQFSDEGFKQQFVDDYTQDIQLSLNDSGSAVLVDAIVEVILPDERSNTERASSARFGDLSTRSDIASGVSVQTTVLFVGEIGGEAVH
jgi:hypothetical protein